jgi:hypothetical protein
MEHMRTLGFKLFGKPFSLDFFEVLDVKFHENNHGRSRNRETSHKGGLSFSEV